MCRINISSIYQYECTLDIGWQKVRSVSRNQGYQHKMIYLDVWDTINGCRAYSQVLLNTSRHNLRIESITRRIIFTVLFWWSRRSDTENHSTSIRTGEFMIIFYWCLRWMLYPLLDKSKIIQLIVTLVSTFFTLEGSSTIKQARKYSFYDDTYIFSACIWFWTMDKSTNSNDFEDCQGDYNRQA